MKKAIIAGVALAAGGAVLLSAKNKKNNAGQSNDADKRTILINSLLQTDGDGTQERENELRNFINSLSSSELEITYKVIIIYKEAGEKIPLNIRNEFDIILLKYGFVE